MKTHRNVKLFTLAVTIALSSVAYYHWFYSNDTLGNNQLEINFTEPSNTEPLVKKQQPSEIKKTVIVSSNKNKIESCPESLLNSSETPLSRLEDCLTLLAHHQTPNINTLTKLLLKISDIDTERAFFLVLEMSPSLGDYVLPELIEYTAGKQPEKIRFLLASLDLESNFSVEEAFYRGYATKFPRKALNEIVYKSTQESSKDNFPGLLSAALGQWAKQDAEQALAWFRNEPGVRSIVAEQAQDIEVAILMNLIDQNILLAEKHVLGIENSPGKSYLLEQVVNYWAEIDSELALDWAKSLTDSNARSIAISSAIHSWVKVGTESDDILTLIVREHDHATRVAIATEVASSLGNKNPQELARIYDRLPAESRENVRAHLIKNWINVDFEATRRWVESLDETAVRDTAVKYMVSFGLDQFPSPSTAVELVQNISDAHLRFELSIEILQTIAAEDPEEARLLSLLMSSLTDVQQNHIWELLTMREAS